MALQIMGMGDSIIFGYPPDGAPPGAPGGWIRRKTWYDRLNTAGWEFDLVGRLSSGSFPDPDHEGWSGIRIDQLETDVLEAALTANPPDLIFFEAGTNDARALQDGPAHLISFLNHLAAFSWQTRIIVSTIPPLDPAGDPVFVPPGSPAYATAFNAALPGIVATQQALGQHVHYVNSGGTLTLADLYSDGVHPIAPESYVTLGNLDADAILALYTVTAPTLAGRIATHVGLAGVDTYRVTISPIGANTIKSVRFGERVNIESVLSLRLDFITHEAGVLSFSVQRILPLDASLELTITDGVGDWTTTIAMAAGPS